MEGNIVPCPCLIYTSFISANCQILKRRDPNESHHLQGCLTARLETLKQIQHKLLDYWRFGCENACMWQKRWALQVSHPASNPLLLQEKGVINRGCRRRGLGDRECPESCLLFALHIGTAISDRNVNSNEDSGLITRRSRMIKLWSHPVHIHVHMSGGSQINAKLSLHVLTLSSFGKLLFHFICWLLAAITWFMTGNISVITWTFRVTLV